MTAVADTSPLCYLVLIGHVELLPALFDSILIPQAVANELSRPSVPDVLKRWATIFPPWLEVAAAPNSELPEHMTGLHRGELEPLLLARQRSANLVLLDDQRARRAAQKLGLPVMGLLGILRVAAERGMIDLTAALGQLSATNFRASPSLLRQILPLP